jgi:hypothetical protein
MDVDWDILAAPAFLSPRPFRPSPHQSLLREGHIAIDLPTVAAPPQAAVSTAVPEAASVGQRWAAWQAKGAAHDRAVRRKMALAAPILIVVAAVVTYAFLGR